MGPVEAAPEHITARAERTLRDRVYGACYTGWQKIDLSIWQVDGEPVPFAEAAAAQYEPAGGGTTWGTPWSTAWFRAKGQVPQEWPADEVDLDIDLGWTWGPATGEALMYDTAGHPIEGIAPGRPRIPWPRHRIDVFIEAAANPMPTFDWYPTDSSLGPMPDAAPRLTVSRAQFVRINRQAERAAQDFVLALAVVKELTDPLQKVRALEALWAGCNVVDDLSDMDGQRWSRVSEELSVVFDTPAGADAGHLHAVANAHIDTAWLWPFRETVRKVARSYANALAVMADDPHMVFASSQVQHLAWMAELHPELFERIRKRIIEGRWIVEGGTWVEPDGNMPSGESFARQFLQGQTWLQEHLGITATSFWLPDTFGYSAGLPQIARGAGCDTFITQKLSWNSVNVFPHTTLFWEGVDGSRLLTHFPPADDYNCSVQPAELAKAQRKMSTQPVADGLFLYGFGDGGGGPTREMGQRLQRLADVAGLPRVTPSTVAQFFAAARELPDPPVWSGELYLEYHRGTLTSQAHIKQAHRRAEALLREAEIWATGAHLQQEFDYPADQLRDLWRELLVMQFHDVLPGTSIGWVHDEALRRLREVSDAAEAIIASALAALAGEGEQVVSATASPHGHPGIPALGCAPAIDRTWEVDASESDGTITLARGNQTVTFTDGLVTSFRLGDRELVPPDGAMGRLRLHPDRPVRWDAWDLDEQHIHGAIEVPVSGAELMPDATVRVTRQWQDSTFTQQFRLREEGLEIRTEVDWHAADVLLRMECDLDVLASSTYVETMYGFLKRPTPRNTSWERAKFETCGHRWLHLGETGFGVALLTPTTYGSRITRHHRNATGVYMRAAFSLLRAPAFPDPRRDAGGHSFVHVIVPGVGAAETIALADQESFPIRTVSGAAPFEPIVRVSGPGLAVEAVKLAEDGSGDVIVRVREVLGARSRGAVELCTPVAEAIECDLVERQHLAVDPGNLEFRQFEVKTLRFR